MDYDNVLNKEIELRQNTIDKEIRLLQSEFQNVQAPPPKVENIYKLYRLVEFCIHYHSKDILTIDDIKEYVAYIRHANDNDNNLIIKTDNEIQSLVNKGSMHYFGLLAQTAQYMLQAIEYSNALIEEIYNK